jgi:hypothetical protein
MFTFSVVKKIGEGRYLCDDLFIIERVRKGRAVKVGRKKLENKHIKNRLFGDDGDASSS